MSAYDSYKLNDAVQLQSNPAFYQAAAEKGVIGCVLLTGKADALEGMSEQDFFGQQAYCVVKAMRCMGEKIDLILLHQKIGELYADRKAELMQYAMQAAVETVTSVFFKEYRRIVKECAGRRELYRLLQTSMEDISKADMEQDVVVDNILNRLKMMSRTRASWVSSYEVAQKTMEYVEAVAAGKIRPIQTGLAKLDSCIGGFFKGELTIIGARPAVGKSAFANHIAIEAARKGKKVCVCSREMSDVQYGQRLLSSVGNIEGSKIRLGMSASDDKGWIQLGDAMNKVANLPISFLFNISTIEDLRAEVRRKVMQNDCDMLIVDYLQLMRTKKNFDIDHMRVGYISKMLKDMTLDMNIPIIALAQVKRKDKAVKDKMPTLDDLKDSGSIEQDADSVMFLHRPQEASDDYIKTENNALFKSIREQDRLQFICLKIAKQRNGQTGVVNMLFNPGKMYYREVGVSERQ